MYNLTYCGHRGSSIKYIVIHYTATTASAENNVTYFSTGDRNASADVFVNKDGSTATFNHDIDAYYSWHCGDGGGRYGITNFNSIGIEVVSAGEEYTPEQKETLKKLVSEYRSRYNIPADHVVRHYDASRKRCPAPYCGSEENDQKWRDLWHFITAETEIEEDIMATKEQAAETVWAWPIGENATPGKNNLEAWQRLSYINDDTAKLKAELLRTDDGGTGDGTEGSLYRRVCWMDQRIRAMDEKLDKILKSI